MREDDIVTNARLGHAAEVAKLNRLRQDLAADESTLARARDLQAAAAADVSRVRGEIAAAVAGALPGFAGDTLLPQLEAWLGRREKALETRAALREAEHELHAADADAASARERLATALAAAGIPHDVASGFDTLSAVALSALDRETSLRTLREAVEGCRRDVARRERGAKDAGRADDVWAAGWKHACAGCWLGEDGTAPSLATVRESLDVIAGLGPALDARAGLADRIEKMERDQAAFAAQVASAEAALGLADTSSPVLQRAQAIAERIEEARDARARKAEKATDLERMRGQQRKLAVERDELNRRKAAMTAHFGVDTLAEVDAKLRDIAHKAGLEGRAEAASRDILLALPSATIAEAEQALDAADRIALEADLSALTAQAEDQRQRCQELLRGARQGEGSSPCHRRRRRRCRPRGAAAHDAARDPGRRAPLSSAPRRRRGGGAGVARLSRATPQLDDGEGVECLPHHDPRRLCGPDDAAGQGQRGPDRRRRRWRLEDRRRALARHPLPALSRAPRRGLSRIARSRPTVPFIADDIMDPFDELRAEEAFRLFADMAEVGQVVYLTHHRHIAEIAQAACPAVRLHRLGMPAG